MKIRISSFLFLFVFLFTLFSSGGPLMGKKALDEIQKDFEDFIDAKNANRKIEFEAENFAGLMRLLGKGPVITKGNGEIIEDRDEIKNFFKNARDDGWGEVTFSKLNAIVVPHKFTDSFGDEYAHIGIEISTFKFKKNPEVSKKGILTSRAKHKEACPWD
jgi:hypothetical protein